MLRNFRKRSVPLMFGLLFVAASCGASTSELEPDQSQAESTVADAGAQDTAPETETEAEVETGAAAEAGSSNNIELLDEGSAPLVELRLQLEEGEQAIRVTQEQSISQSGLAGGVPPTSLAYAIDMVNTVTKDGENFVVVSEFVDVVAVNDDPVSAQVIATVKEQFVGVTTTSTLDPTAQLVGEPVLSGTENVEPQLVETLNQLSDSGLAAPLPVEAVGVGGSWKVTQSLELMGIEVRQEITYVVAAIDGNNISLDSTVTQFVEEGSVVQLFGQELTVELWDSTGSSQIELDLTKAASSSTGQTSTKQLLSIPAGELTQEAEVSITIEQR